MLNYHNPKRDFFSALCQGGLHRFPQAPFLMEKVAALDNMKANFHCAHLHNLSPQGTGDVPTALLGAQTASL